MNKKVVVIHQPDFVPYLGFFHRFLHADMYIALDHVQYVNGSSRAWTHRDKIKTAQGEKWLAVSVKKAPRDIAISQIELSTEIDWQQANLRLLEQNYRKAPCYNELMPEIERLYALPFYLLRDFNMASIEMLMDMLDVRIPWVWSSSLDPAGTKKRIIGGLVAKGFRHALSFRHGCAGLFSARTFCQGGHRSGLAKDFNHPVYAQQFGDFVPYLSALDVLFNPCLSGCYPFQ
jgi:hypothetical protein